MSTIRELTKFSNGKELDIEYPIELKNKNGKVVYYEDSDGCWFKQEYDENGKETYYENSDGFWRKHEYDENGNEKYYEDSYGFWREQEYDENGKETYYENSDGQKRGTPRPTVKEMTAEEISKALGYEVKVVK